MYLLDRFLDKFVQVGWLRVVDVNATSHDYGPDRDCEGPPLTVILKKRLLHWKLALRPRLYLGEAYMDGSLEVQNGSIFDIIDLCGRNIAQNKSSSHGAISRWIVRIVQRFTQLNSLLRAKRNVAHHYDLSRELYESFLDTDLQYSCAYFSSSALTLDEAQAAKRQHLAAKLLLRPNQRVLDIGSGWGGLALEFARAHGVTVEGITLSHEQLLVAKNRVQQSNYCKNVLFHLKDYRDVAGEYDRIVSVGMFEHVGVPYYGIFFKKIHDLLRSDGVALIHSIGSITGPGIGNPWFRKYIFPGGYAPALSEVLPAIEAAGLMVTDIEVLRLHYAETLRRWRERFLANWHQICHLYDERFRRMWEFYLASSEAGFRYDGLAVFQIQLCKRLETIPLTRDYIHDAEHPGSGALREHIERAA